MDSRVIFLMLPDRLQCGGNKIKEASLVSTLLIGLIRIQQSRRAVDPLSPAHELPAIGFRVPGFS